jgi:hypothetical protein
MNSSKGKASLSDFGSLKTKNTDYEKRLTKKEKSSMAYLAFEIFCRIHPETRLIKAI